jgi:GMP synthase (glutamine-hydrolysing)
MRCLAFRHLPHEGLGLFRAPLLEAGWAVDEKDVRDPRDVPDEGAGREWDLLIVLGGPMSVGDGGEIPTLAREMDLLRRRLDAGRPALGICLGAQMMASVLGARVYKRNVPEIGWHEVAPLEEGRVDPVFRALVPEPGVTLHWHEDSFDLPPGCVPLARSAECEHQAFRHGLYNYAIQFHPEVPAEVLPTWTDLSHIPLDESAARRIQSEGLRHEPAMKRRAEEFISAYLRALAGGAGLGMSGD